MLGLVDLSSWITFTSYVIFGISQGLLVTSTKDEDNEYQYNPVTVVLLVECTKLSVCVILFIVEKKSAFVLVQEIIKNYKAMFYYFIPAALYCVYNTLVFYNLSTYDPTSYLILMQFRVVIAGVIYQVLFQRRLTKIQWLSMTILTLGCMTKELDHQQIQGETLSLYNLSLSPAILLILLQVSCSCFAGVYTEYLLKGHTNCGEVHLWIQNIFMYSNSILCNTVFLVFSQESVGAALKWESIEYVLHIKVILLICNNAAMGLVTSVFLKNLNSILKNFASALEPVLTMILSWAIFGIEITMFGVVSTSSVVLAVQLYSRNPVVNRKTTDLSTTIIDMNDNPNGTTTKGKELEE